MDRGDDGGFGGGAGCQYEGGGAGGYSGGTGAAHGYGGGGGGGAWTAENPVLVREDAQWKPKQAMTVLASGTYEVVDYNLHRVSTNYECVCMHVCMYVYVCRLFMLIYFRKIIVFFDEC